MWRRRSTDTKVTGSETPEPGYMAANEDAYNIDRDD